MRVFAGCVSLVFTVVCAAAGLLRVLFNHNIPGPEFLLCCLLWIVPLITAIVCFSDPFGRPQLVVDTAPAKKAVPKLSGTTVVPSVGEDSKKLVA